MIALVTGDLGFVGRHMVPALMERGYDVLGLDVKRGPHEDVRDWFRHAGPERFDLVVHLAAVVGGRTKIDNAPLDVAVDLAIDAEMFGWAVRTHQPRVVYYSSSAAYPVERQTAAFRARHGGTARLAEAGLDPSRGIVGLPDMSYGWAKMTGEALAMHAEKEGVRTHIFRPFSGYGEDQDLDYPFPSFAARAKAKADPFDVWGTGDQTRDFIHIEDVVAGTLAAVERDVRGAVNLCTGVETSFNSLARQFMQAAGYEGELRHHRDAPMGVMHRVGSPAKMRTFFQPRITLQEGIERALA